MSRNREFVEYYIEQKNVDRFKASLVTLGFWLLRRFSPNGLIADTDNLTGELFVDEEGNRIMIAVNPENMEALIGSDWPASPVVRDEA